MTRPFFSKDRISHFDIFDRHAEDALHQAAIRIAEGYPVDFQDMVSRFTLDSATKFLFDQDVGSLSAGLDYPVSSPLHGSASSSHPSNAFAEAFLEGQVLTSLRTVGGRHWPLFEWSEKVRPQREIVNRYIDPIISKAIQRHNTQGPKLNGDEAETLLEHLIRATQDHKTLQDEILNIMIAGRDTTACTLTYAVYMLAENPHVLQKLRDEVLSKIGASKRPDFDDLRSMRYLRAFINETLRLYPPVPFDMRATKVATTLPPARPGEKPFFIPQDRNVLYSVFLMHRRTDLWGPDAAVFDPDRFLDERHKRVIKNPYIFLPFNGGPRICLGQQFAYNEVSYFLVKLLQQFSGFSLALDAFPPSCKPPAEWATSSGTKGTEKVFPGVHLTMVDYGSAWKQTERSKRKPESA
ncbi:hypothetical protein ONZ45_g13448 [Pleurotus djamor]|nr:hypothetical protein ONZ45_g13448 [Pleurotus djamor]